MKSTSVVFVALAAFGFFALAADKQSGSDKNASPIVGTWELVSEKWGDAKEFTDPPAKTKKITNSMGGTYKYAGDSYIEIPEFAFEGMGAYVGKEQKFTVKIEGDKWIHSGVLSAGQKLEEIWKRVK